MCLVLTRLEGRLVKASWRCIPLDTKASLNAHKADAVFIPIGCTDRDKLDLIASARYGSNAMTPDSTPSSEKVMPGEGELRSDTERSLLWSEHRLLIHDEMIPQRVPVQGRPVVADREAVCAQHTGNARCKAP